MSSSFSHDFEQTPDEIRVGLFAPPGAGCFPLVFFTFWTSGCLFLTVVILVSEPLFVLAFMAPFWAISALFGWITATMFFRRDDFRLAVDGVTYTSRIRGFCRTRRVPLAELVDFRGPDSYASEAGPMSGVEVVTTGRSIYFKPRLPTLDDRHLVQRLNARLAELREQFQVSRPSDRYLADCRDCPLPSDGKWREVEGADGFLLEEHGTLPRHALAATLAINLIVNGVAWTLLGGAIHNWQHPDPEKSGAVVYLLLGGIVLGAIGLALLRLLLICLLEPFRVTEWSVSDKGVERRVRYFGRRWIWRSPEEAVRWIDIDETSPSWEDFLTPRPTEVPLRTQYLVVARSLAGADLWTIRGFSGLTLGEALWIKGRIQSRNPSLRSFRPIPADPRQVGLPPDRAERAAEIPLCVDCLEPLVLLSGHQVAGSSCPACGLVQPASSPPEEDTEQLLPKATRGARSDDPLPEGIDIERSDSEGLRFSILLVPPGQIRQHGPWMLTVGGIVFATAAVGMWWLEQTGPQTDLSRLFSYIPLIMAPCGFMTLAGGALVILKGRVTVDMCRDGLQVRWGWGLLSKSCWAPLEHIDGFRIERSTGRSQWGSKVRRFQRPVGVVVVQGHSWVIIDLHGRSFSKAVLRLMQAKLTEFRGD